MANYTLSPNMNLIVPTVSVDPGPDWANNINASLSILDQHNHSSGSGVQINQNGIFLSSSSAPLDSLGYNTTNAFNLRSVRFAPQLSPLNLSTDVGCVYESGGNFYYNNSAGTAVQITNGNSIVGAAGTITGLPSGTASASYSGGTFIFQSATSTAANIDAGSYILRNSTASSFGLTLQPPNAMAANYSLTLPAVPSTLSFMTLDTSGNMGTSSNVSGSQIATGSITGSQLANNTITRTQEAAVGQQVSSSCGFFSTTHGVTPQNVTNLSVTLTTTGRPVMIMLQSDGSSNAASWGAFTNSSINSVFANLVFVRDSTNIGLYQSSFSNNSAGGQYGVSGSFPSMLDVVAAGNHTYLIQLYSTSTSMAAFLYNAVLVAYEL